MSQFHTHLLFLAILVPSVQLFAYAGLETSALKGEVDVVDSLVRRLNKSEQSDIEHVAQALRKVNDKIDAIYAGREHIVDKFKRVKNITQPVLGAAAVCLSIAVLRTMINDLTGLELSWIRVVPPKQVRDVIRAKAAVVVCLGIIAALYTVKATGVLLDELDNPHRATTVYLQKLLAIREILKGFLPQ